MAHCRICDDDLDSRPTAIAEFEGNHWDVCLSCGVAAGGVFEGITLTPDGVAQTMANVATAAQAIADLLSAQAIADLLARYRREA